MRISKWLALAAGIAGLTLASAAPATAFGCHTSCPPEGWGKSRVVRHWVYYPRYTHVCNVDPYAYQYSPRGYYPYYNSGYWTSAATARRRARAHYYHWNTQPPRFRYYRYWGGPARWNHTEWHRRHHGFHHRWHW